MSDKDIADLAYISGLSQRKITYSSKDAIINLGHTVCDARAAGNTDVAIALEIAKKGFSAEDAGYVVGAAESAYCPQFK